MTKIKVGIVGVTGYAGQELLKILLRHPSVSIEHLSSRQLNKPSPVGEWIPAFRGVGHLSVRPFKISEAIEASDLLFLCLPHGVAMELVPKILRKPMIRVIDLSGDFRLRSASAYERAYRLKHKASRLLQEAAYGLSEWERDSIRTSRLIANPGCYPTATLLGLAPLAEARLLSSEGLIVDAKSGVTGAGRSVKEELLFSEVNEDLRAYKVNLHQHIPEMEQQVSHQSRRSIRMTFVPHLVPMNRGIYATIYAPLKRRMNEKQLRSLYEESYGEEPFVRLLPSEKWPQVKSVERTNFCDIGVGLDSAGTRAIILSALDNLVKGAAGQAVQNMNLLYGLEETRGLIG